MSWALRASARLPMPASREPGPDMQQLNLSASLARPALPLIAARSQQDLLASRMVDVRPVRDVDHSDHVLFIVDLVPDTVMPAPCGPVALKRRRDKLLPDALRILRERPSYELPHREGSRRRELVLKRATRLRLDSEVVGTQRPRSFSRVVRAGKGRELRGKPPPLTCPASGDRS